MSETPGLSSVFARITCPTNGPDSKWQYTEFSNCMLDSVVGWVELFLIYFQLFGLHSASTFKKMIFRKSHITIVILYLYFQIQTWNAQLFHTMRSRFM